jgi:hypothetical protein
MSTNTSTSCFIPNQNSSWDIISMRRNPSESVELNSLIRSGPLNEYGKSGKKFATDNGNDKSHIGQRQLHYQSQKHFAKIK